MLLESSPSCDGHCQVSLRASGEFSCNTSTLRQSIAFDFVLPYVFVARMEGHHDVQTSSPSMLLLSIPGTVCPEGIVITTRRILASTTRLFSESVNEHTTLHSKHVVHRTFEPPYPVLRLISPRSDVPSAALLSSALEGTRRPLKNDEPKFDAARARRSQSYGLLLLGSG